jgi:hypothetical protein
MKSPFPGMDPYIEACDLWEDFHDDLIADIKRVLAVVLPEGYLARTRKRSYLELIETEGKQRRAFVPDVSVTSPPGPKGAVSKKTPAAAPGKGEPVSMRAFIDEAYREKFIDIYETRPERRLVTSIEALSPSNKRPGSVGWRKYQRKRKALLLGKANLVEIDLLRGGSRMPMLDPWPGGPYSVLVARADDAPTCRVWGASFDWPLPPVTVPLAPPDPDVTLELQPLIDGIFERNNYGREIDYQAAVTPALDRDELVLVERRLHAAKILAGWHRRGKKPGR